MTSLQIKLLTTVRAFHHVANLQQDKLKSDEFLFV